MEKGIPLALQETYDSPAVTDCLLVRIMTKDGRLFGLTDLDVNVYYDPAAYDPFDTGDDWGPAWHYADNGGVAMSRLEQAADMSVDNAEFTILPGDDSVTEEELLAGLFDLAEVRIYRVNYRSLGDGHELVAAGQMGNTEVSENFGKVEFRSMTDLLKQPEADLYTIPCKHIFGGPKCPKPYDWTAGTVTAVDPTDAMRVFADSALTPDNNFYVPGVVEWLTGANAGIQMEIDQNTAGTFALSLGMPSAIQIGDTFRVRQDCSKIWDDAERGCLYHWGTDRNIYFGGFPDIPVADGGSSMVPGAQINAR